MSTAAKRRRAETKEGGLNGEVIDMKLVGDGVWQSIYSIPIQIGPIGQGNQYEVQLDTGSSDLWVASKDCRTDSCSGFDSSKLFTSTDTTQDTGQRLNLTYVQGSVEGPIVWDTVQLGSYGMSSQAFGKGENVEHEPLSEHFVGIMGLALTQNSDIANKIAPTDDDDGGGELTPDGATIASNLFGLTPVREAPKQRYFGVLLERDGMPASESDPAFIPSKFSIGRHPGEDLSGILTDLPPEAPSDMNSYLNSILPEHTVTIDAAPDGRYLFWKTTLTLLSVYNPDRVDIPLGGTQTLYPSVILDTGGSTIIARPEIANAIYGAYDIGPADDGNYYLPCDKILNVSVTLSTLPPIPIHPLDLSGNIPNNAPGAGSGCMGVIQSSPALSGAGAPADIVLGAAFLRNVYSVLWHQMPDFEGGGDDDDENDGNSTRSGPRTSRTTARTSTGTGTDTNSRGGTTTSGTGTRTDLSTSGTGTQTGTSGSVTTTGSGTNTKPTQTNAPTNPTNAPQTTPPPPPPSNSNQGQNQKRSVGTRRRVRKRAPKIDTSVPAISLIPLTNITLALDQFHTVRVLQQPLTSAGQHRGAGDSSNLGSHKLSVGIIILLAIVGFGVLVAALFGAWWFKQKRTLKKRGLQDGGAWGDGRKLELRALGAGSSSDGSAVGRKKSGEGSYHRSVRSGSESSVKFVGVAGEAQEFGENRGRHERKRSSTGRARTNSRSMSGYFREPEPWEIAGGYSDDESVHEIHPDDEEGRVHHGLAVIPDDENEGEITPALRRSPNQSGEVNLSPEQPMTPLPSSSSQPHVHPPSDPFATPGEAPMNTSLHRQLMGAIGGVDRYPTLPPSGPFNARSNDLVDVSTPSAHQFNTIPNPSALSSDSYFPSLPPSSEFGQFEPRGRRMTESSPFGAPIQPTFTPTSGRKRNSTLPSAPGNYI